MFPADKANIRLLCLDVDGVMTDGRLLLDADGRETKCFHIHDGLGIRLWQSTGREVAVVTGRASKPLRDRCQELGIELLAEGQGDKRPAWEEILKQTGMQAAQAAMMGDDLPDLPLVRAAGLGIAVSNAVPEVKDAADWVTTRAGGDGAIREAVECILKANDEWDDLVSRFNQAKADQT